MRKKVFLTVLICLIAALQTSAQESSFEQNDNVLSLGIGFGGTLYSSRSYILYAGYDRLPTISFSYERCIVGELFNEQSALGVGGIVGYNYASYSTWTSTDILVGVRGAFHYAFVDNLDTYVGVLTGYNVHSWKWKNSSTSTLISGSSGFTYGYFAGARYYFAGPLAAFAELGYGYTFVNAGISLKF